MDETPSPEIAEHSTISGAGFGGQLDRALDRWLRAREDGYQTYRQRVHMQQTADAQAVRRRKARRE